MNSSTNSPLLDSLENLGLYVPIDKYLSHYNYIQEDLLAYLSSFSLRINKRFKTCAGLVRYKERAIELHPLLAEEKYAQEREDTLLHEIAHIIAFKQYKHRGHGREWKKVLKDLGFSHITRCHNYAFLEGRSRPHVYTCKDCGYEFNRTRKMHRMGTLNMLYHPSCLKKASKGRFHYINNRD